MSDKLLNVLKNTELNNRVFILANAPSVANENLTLLKNEIVIGMNASTILEKQFNFSSKYYVMSDKRFIMSSEKRQWATDKLSKTTIRFLRRELRDYDEPYLEKRTYYINSIARDGFSHNLSHGFYYGCTTTMLALQLAYYLGFQKTYLLGCDLRYQDENPRFYAEKNPQLEDSFISVQLANIVNASIEYEKEGREIINCSAKSFLRPYLKHSSFSEALKG
ncbi:MAG: DUF115 domain-containing protein [Campylobacteraceae bacterium]|jgi:hypothetical protein|nr:DUF115 domain-containing protein [Campylobacteraceae bacterium]